MIALGWVLWQMSAPWWVWLFYGMSCFVIVANKVTE